MTPERWREVLRLHAAAAALPEAEREAFLARECADEELRTEVRRMLAAPDTEAFLEPPALDQPAAGRDLGDFTLLEEIGRGGMGVVYRALQRSLGRIVAVKVLPASFALPQRTIERFEREARTMARLAHPNLVSILAFGEERGLRYLAMEYVDGPNLAQELLRLRADLGAEDDRRAHLPSSRASDYFRSVAESVRQVADGLAFSHEHGIVHRDVKPSNLLLDPSGRVKVVDFGLARDEHLGSLSTSGDLVGTPHYMSPEQARAHRHVVDHRTDIYSLGVVLFELLTLQRPFEGNTSQEVIHNLLKREPPGIRRLNPRVPRDLETICAKAMSKEPNGRYPEAGQLADDLRRFLDHEAIAARAPGLATVLGRQLRRHRRPLSLIATVVVAGLAGVLGTRAHARSVERETAIEELRAALTDGGLHDLPLSRQLELYRSWQALAAEGAVLAGDTSNVITIAGREFDALRRKLTQDGLADLQMARDPTVPEGYREQRRLAAQQKFLHASHLFPEDDELRRLAATEAAFPTLTVRALDHTGVETAARVYLREVDVGSSGVGPKRFLGDTPLSPTPVVPGYYRVTVVFALGGFRELICTPGPADMALELAASRSADESDLLRNMVRFEATPFVLADDPECDWALEGRSVQLEAFYLDQTEVSNAEYRRFTEATGHRLPAYWRFVEDWPAFLAEHGDLPVCGVAWKDAVAYAEWAGKRLPTAAEWLFAAGGREHRPFPYSSDPAATPRGNVSAPFEGYRGGRDAWAKYLVHAAPVGGNPEARSPEGLYHLFGNVGELTESMMVEKLLGSDLLVPRPLDRLAFGGAWNAIAARQALRAPEQVGIGPYYERAEIGFRCAKSAEP